jgi:lysophospholipase L1-like esterase
MPSAERVVLCYGDSNTYGWIPVAGGRFARDVRWPGVLASELGAGWHVIEEGLGGRTTIFDDPVLPGRNGKTYLEPCLLSHEPLDAVVIALGTNDLKVRFAASAADIARGVALLAETALAFTPKVLALGLPTLGPLDARNDELAGAHEKADRMRPHLREWAAATGFELLELHELVSFADEDGFHLDVAGHRVVGEAVARRVASVF